MVDKLDRQTLEVMELQVQITSAKAVGLMITSNSISNLVHHSSQASNSSSRLTKEFSSNRFPRLMSLRTITKISSRLPKDKYLSIKRLVPNSQPQHHRYLNRFHYKIYLINSNLNCSISQLKFRQSLIHLQIYNLPHKHLRTH